MVVVFQRFEEIVAWIGLVATFDLYLSNKLNEAWFQRLQRHPRLSQPGVLGFFDAQIG